MNRELPPLTPTQRRDLQEAVDERAAILEFDAGQPRLQAEMQARNALRVYRYRVTDRPTEWLTLIAPGCDLDEARQTLIQRFGAERVIEVVPQPRARRKVLT